jgi:hypothetical protein
MPPAGGCRDDRGANAAIGAVVVIFVYLRDGQRLDVGEAVTFVHRGESLICLDKEGDEVRRFSTREVSAYGHVAYPYDPEFVSKPLDAEERQPSGGHHRRRRRSLST